MKSIAIIALLLLISSCGPVFYHDSSNPCATGDQTECDAWKTKCPNEYEQYKKRGGVDVFNPKSQ